jgi:hypothetical protein
MPPSNKPSFYNPGGSPGVTRSVSPSRSRETPTRQLASSHYSLLVDRADMPGDALEDTAFDWAFISFTHGVTPAVPIAVNPDGSLATAAFNGVVDQETAVRTGLIRQNVIVRRSYVGTCSKKRCGEGNRPSAFLITRAYGEMGGPCVDWFAALDRQPNGRNYRGAYDFSH